MSLRSWLTRVFIGIILVSLPTHPTAAQTEPAPQLVLEAGGHLAIIRELLFTADGRELVSVSDDKTIRIWSVAADGRRAALARTIRGQIDDGRAGALMAAALSPPNATGRQQWLAVGGFLAGSDRERYAIRLHDYASGEVVALLPGHRDIVLALVFSPDGRWLASASKDTTVRLWDLTALQGQNLTRPALELTGHSEPVYDLAWSKTGDRLASASYDRLVGLWDTSQLAQGQPTSIGLLRGHDSDVRSVAFHPDSTVLVSGGKDQTLRLWRASDGKALKKFAKADHKCSALAFSPDGRWLLVGNDAPPRPERLTLYEYPSGKEQLVFTGHTNTVLATAFHPSGQWVASGGGEQKEILLWQVPNGDILSRLEGTGRTIGAVGFSNDGRYVGWGQTTQYQSINDRGPVEHWFDLTKLTRVSPGPGNTAVVRAQEKVQRVALSIATSKPHGYAYRLQVTRGSERLGSIERDEHNGYWHSAYTLTPNAQHVLSGGQNGMLELYTLDGAVRARLIGHTGEIKAVAVSADGRWAVSGAADQTVSLWSLADLPASEKAEIAPTLTLFPASDGEWVAWTPEGFFTGSPQGVQRVGYSVNRGLNHMALYVAIDQLYERFYRPDLLHTRLHGEAQQVLPKDRPITPAETILASSVPPRVSFVSPATDTTLERSQTTVQVALTDQGGGIGKTVWKVNGTTVAVHAVSTKGPAPVATVGGSRPAESSIQITQPLTLLPGDNTLELVAYDRNNEVTSPPAALTLTLKDAPAPTSAPPPPSPVVPKLPTAKPPSTKPPASPPPAQPVNGAPSATSASLHVLAVGVDHYRDKALWLNFAVADVRALTSTLQRAAAALFHDVTVTTVLEEHVSHGGLEAAFAQVASKVKPQDAFVLYLAGHGVTRDGRYHYFPHDFRYRNDDSVRQEAINQDHLQTWLASVPARKSLVLIDTCESGSFSQSLVALRGLVVKTAMDRLARATGRATIVAATDNQPALEGYEGHGVFTYVLLQALTQADTNHGNRDGVTSIFELAAYVDHNVPSLTQRVFNFEQFPQVHMVGSDFPIGAVLTSPRGK